jgi:hypothetical protein
MHFISETTHKIMTIIIDQQQKIFRTKYFTRSSKNLTDRKILVGSAGNAYQYYLKGDSYEKNI